MIYLRGLLSLAAALFAAAAASEQHVQDAFRTIQKSVYNVYAPINQCRTNNCCKLSDGSCDVSAFPKDKTTLVFPGGDTRCIFSYSTEFSFQVIPGNNDKVLLYFQGGGACWDEFSTSHNFCSTDAIASDLVGVFDHTNAENPFKDYTVVQILYCSGDLHAGNVQRSYTDEEGVPVQQMGQNNVNSALNWIASQQASGQLASTLTDLVIMGCSAGSIGAQIWAETALKQLAWNHAAVVPDSYVGVFPPGTQGPLIYDFGACNIADPTLQDSCNAQELTLQDITDTAIGNIEAMEKAVTYGFIQSKADAVQISFYIAVGALTPGADATITPEEFYTETNQIFERYNSHSSFVNYLVNGNKHCFTNAAVVYDADTTGKEGTPSSGEPTMVGWLGTMPVPCGGNVATECYGDELEQAAWDGTEYCDQALANKAYTNTCAATAPKTLLRSVAQRV